MTNWPWPLDGVQNWFEGLWDDLSDWFGSIWRHVTDVFNDIVNFVWDGFYDMYVWLQRYVITPIYSSANWVISSFYDMINWLWGAVSGSINWLSNTITYSIQWLENSISPALDFISNFVGDISSWIYNAVNDAMGWFSNSISSLLNNLSRGLDSLVTWVGSITTDITSWVGREFNSLRDFMETIVHGALSGVAGALGAGLKDMFDWILGGLAGTIEFMLNTAKGAASWIGDVFNGFVQDITNRFTAAVKIGSPPPEFAGSMQDMVEGLTERVMVEIKKAETASFDINGAVGVGSSIAIGVLGAASLGLSLSAAFDAGHPLKKWGANDIVKQLFGYLGVSHLIAPIITTPYKEGVLEGLSQYYKKVYKLTVLGAGEVQRLLSRNLITEDVATDYLQRGGYHDETVEAFKKSAYSIPSIMDLRAMVWRGLITEDVFKDLLILTGMKPEVIPYEIELNKQIPDPADMIRFYVKEAHIAEKHAELPNEFVSDMKFRGFGEKWTKLFWGAHWVLPSIGDMKQMLYRTDFSIDNYKTLLKYHDFEPKYRDWLLQTSYSTIGRIDVRRAWELGIIDDAEMEKRMAIRGYNPEDAKLMAEIHMAVALSAEKNDLRDEAIANYAEGLISEEQLKARLIEIKIPDSVLDFHIGRAKSRLDRKLKLAAVTAIRKAYKLKNITEEEARAQLREVGILIDTENMIINAEKAAMSIKTEAKRKLTTAQLFKALGAELLTHEIVKERLLEMDYIEADADLLLEIEAA